MLVAGGHHVTGTTRSEKKAAELRAKGVEPAILNALDREAVKEAVAAARPDVIVHQLTAISGPANLRKFDDYFAATNRLRTEGTDNLLAAAAASEVTRIVAQSFTGWPNERTGGPVKTEADPIDPNPTKASRQSVAAIRHVEEAVTRTPGGIVLRYGGFYGPGNALGAGGELLEMVRQRKLPVVGGGTGIWSFVHIDDAVDATVLAIVGDQTGLFNIVDDEPAPVSSWLPYLAEAIGAKPPTTPAGVAGQAAARRAWRLADDADPGLVECQGEARARLVTAVRELARRLPVRPRLTRDDPGLAHNHEPGPTAYREW